MFNLPLALLLRKWRQKVFHLSEINSLRMANFPAFSFSEACVLNFKFILEFAWFPFPCPFLSPSAYHLQALLADFRTDNADSYVKCISYWNRLPIVSTASLLWRQASSFEDDSYWKSNFHCME